MSQPTVIIFLFFHLCHCLRCFSVLSLQLFSSLHSLILFFYYVSPVKFLSCYLSLFFFSIPIHIFSPLINVLSFPLLIFSSPPYSLVFLYLNSCIFFYLTPTYFFFFSEEQHLIPIFLPYCFPLPFPFFRNLNNDALFFISLPLSLSLNL